MSYVRGGAGASFYRPRHSSFDQPRANMSGLAWLALQRSVRCQQPLFRILRASANYRCMSSSEGSHVSSISSVGFRLSRSGRFTGETDPLMEQFNASIGYDKRMWRQDIAGSIAYAAALGRAGLLKAEEVSSLQAGLQKVRAEWEEGKFELKPGDEVSDIFSFSFYQYLKIFLSTGHPHSQRKASHRIDRSSWRQAAHRPFSK